MIMYILSWMVSGLAVLITSKIIPGFEVKSFVSACIAALIIGLVNPIVWWLLFVFTLPINILTLGLFTLVINGAALKFCAALTPGFEINSWFAAILGSFVLSLVGVGLHYILI